MDDYAELQFVERNANIESSQQRYGQQRPGNRTFVAHMPRHAVQQPHVIYAQGPGLGVGIGGGNLLGRMTTGQVIDMVAQIFAALMPLPAAPVATADAGVDVGNLILYQSSLAQYAKRDEQVRTVGNLITKLVG